MDLLMNQYIGTVLSLVTDIVSEIAIHDYKRTW